MIHQVRTNLNPNIKFPSPGSPKAISQGCTCPPIPNMNGVGHFQLSAGSQTVFFLNDDCPVHWIKESTRNSEISRRLLGNQPQEAKSDADKPSRSGANG